VVGAAEVVPRQHCAGALLDSWAAALAWAAAGAGEQQGGRIAAGREPAADRLHHLGGQRDLADAGIALGPWFEAATELAACLVANVDDLHRRDGLVEVDTAAVQAGELADTQAGAEQSDDAAVGVAMVVSRAPSRLKPWATISRSGIKWLLYGMSMSPSRLGSRVVTIIRWRRGNGRGSRPSSSSACKRPPS
jgi:hypothetical protein